MGQANIINKLKGSMFSGFLS